MVKDLKKKHQQGRLPSGVTLAALIQKSTGGGSTGTATAPGGSGMTPEAPQTVEEALKELSQLAGLRGAPDESSGDQTRRLSPVADNHQEASEALLGPGIEEYVDSDVEDVFEEIAGRMGTAVTRSDEVKYTQVGTLPAHVEERGMRRSSPMGRLYLYITFLRLMC